MEDDGWISGRPTRDRNLSARYREATSRRYLLARWLERGARFLFLLEPTRGVDVGARESIYAAIRSTLAESNLGILVVTSDAEEALNICDRLVVMQRGRISARFERNEATLQALAAAVGE